MHVFNSNLIFLDFKIHRTEENGGDLIFPTFEELEASYAKQDIHPGDLKQKVEEEINKLLKPIQEIFSQTSLKELTANAYPKEVKTSQYQILFSNIYICKH